MSKYEELKAEAVSAARKYRETGSLEDREALDKAEDRLCAFTCAAAEMIERARDVLKYNAEVCRYPSGFKTCAECLVRHPTNSCKTAILLAEMEAL